MAKFKYEIRIEELDDGGNLVNTYHNINKIEITNTAWTDAETEEDQSFTCPGCQKTVTFDDADVLGACEGNVFCPDCSTEVEPTTGLPGVLCLSCDCGGCTSLRNLRGGDRLAKHREALRGDAILQHVALKILQDKAADDIINKIVADRKP